MLASVSEKLGRAGGGIVVGEWSGALNPGSLQRSGAEFEERRDFVSAQMALFDKYCGGWFFWTYKKEHRGDPGWSWQDAVEAGMFPTWVGIKYRRIEADDIMKRMNIRDRMKDDALGDLFSLAITCHSSHPRLYRKTHSTLVSIPRRLRSLSFQLWVHYWLGRCLYIHTIDPNGIDDNL
jgi:hypothetical protein